MKKIIITDPCYIIKDSDWSNACDYCFRNDGARKSEPENELNKFKDFITSLLQIASGDKNAIAENTGFGDWTNEIDGRMFYADSGMVCVVEDTDKLEEYFEKENIHLPIGVAYVEVPSSATYEVDTSDPNWSVVKIIDNDEVIMKSLDGNEGLGEMGLI